MLQTELHSITGCSLSKDSCNLIPTIINISTNHAALSVVQVGICDGFFRLSRKISFSEMTLFRLTFLTFTPKIFFSSAKISSTQTFRKSCTFHFFFHKCVSYFTFSLIIHLFFIHLFFIFKLYKNVYFFLQTQWGVLSPKTSPPCLRH